MDGAALRLLLTFQRRAVAPGVAGSVRSRCAAARLFLTL